jgi:hypothetical protein
MFQNRKKNANPDFQLILPSFVEWLGCGLETCLIVGNELIVPLRSTQNFCLESRKHKKTTKTQQTNFCLRSAIVNKKFTRRGADSVSMRGRTATDITTTRRPGFLSGAVGVDVPCIQHFGLGDQKKQKEKATCCAPAARLGEAPLSGSWHAKYYDGFVWRDLRYTFFFQDLSAKHR